MLVGRTNVNKFLVEEQRRNPELAGDFSMLISDIVRSCKAVSQQISRGALAVISGDNQTARQDAQSTLRARANATIIEHCEWGGHLAALSSEAMEKAFPLQNDGKRGKFLLAFDPLDGASNIELNLTVGSIFSVLRAPDTPSDDPADDFLQPGSAQMAAGYALYGSSTMLVLTVGTGTHGFTLNRDIGEFVLTHPAMQIPVETPNFSINASNERFWEPPIRRYVDECLAGQTGIREKDFNMRWAAAMVADVHRILLRGGVFMYPSDTRDVGKHGRLAQLHKVNPMAMIIEQAGGLASTGYERIADLQPTGLHDHAPAILGSRDEVERIDRYHVDYLNGEDKPFSSPLFSTRTLLRSG